MYSRKWTMDNGQWTIKKEKILNSQFSIVNSEIGQTLMELIVVTSVSVIIIGALVFATISSLRNASFSKNQSQATKLAQEGIEKLRSFRDRNRNGSVDYIKSDSTHTARFNELWGISFSCPTNCQFHYNSGGTTLIGGNVFETVLPNFQRQILIEDSGTDTKKVTVIVSWTDFAGPHESKLTTILRKL